MPLPIPDKPTPREPRTSRQTHQLSIQNRRREYLQRNPSYFAHLDHELKDPILYERLVKRFHTPAQRESERQKRGYGRTLEADLLRGEARLSALNQPGEDEVEDEDEKGDNINENHMNDDGAFVGVTENGKNGLSAASTATPRTAAAAAAVDEPWDRVPDSQEDGQEMWMTFLKENFVRGGDEEFDYATVDEDEDLDEGARREEQNVWFEDEEPDGESGGEWNTGVQDY